MIPGDPHEAYAAGRNAGLDELLEVLDSMLTDAEDSGRRDGLSEAWHLALAFRYPTNPPEL